MLFMASGYYAADHLDLLETMALASYILAGYFKRETRSIEAALKYSSSGRSPRASCSTASRCSTGPPARCSSQRSRGAARLAQDNPLVPLGWILLAAGLFFKVAAVPFHIWTPDVYVGAPTPVTAWLAVASKAASFAILLRIFYEGLMTLRVEWQTLVGHRRGRLP